MKSSGKYCNGEIERLYLFPLGERAKFKIANWKTKEYLPEG